MKELLIIILTLLLMSCSNDYCEKCNHSPIITYKAEKNDPHYCFFRYKGYNRESVSFEDSCYKYNIGDTIK